ncbi:MAG: mechanosensitive ion channel, partial [Bacteroidota bacterium]|nr:mechanosensitive ion channel [Bacteroidota bacterium]
ARLPFSVVEITSELGAAERLISASEELDMDREALEEFASEVDSLFAQAEGLLGDTALYTLENLSSRELDQVIQQDQFYIDQIDERMNHLSRIARELENQSLHLQVNRQRWILTLEQGEEDATLEARVERIESTIQRIDETRKSLQDDLVFVLEEQDELNEKKTELDELLTRVKEQKAELDETLFKRDVPGFFKDLGSLGDRTLFKSHWKEFTKSFGTDLALLKSGYLRSMIFSVLLLIAGLTFTSWFRKNHHSWIAEDKFKLSELHQIFINSPVASALFFITLMIRLLIPDLPRTFFALNIVLMMIPMAILMVRVYGSVFRTWVIVLVILTTVNMLYELSYHPGAMLRILLLAVCLTGIWLFAWICKRKPYNNLIKHRFVYRSFRLLVITFLAMQALAIIANLSGTFRLAEFFALIPLHITIAAIAIQLASKMADSILYLALASNYMQKLNVIRDEFQVIFRKASWLVNFILLVAFISIALNILRINERVYAWGRGVLSDGMKIGAVEISPGSILIFVFVIWLSIMITRMISHILEKDVFTRVKAAKGVPSTIILMLKIVLISGGFFLAAAASGMHLTNLSIVLGAFSVGIGFGLQNIFNNMVSGLILAFERPISVGDVVQVGQLIGTVRSIGLRSSTVKSFDGAEVIVPNGNLISNEMINWTLSDSNRRMDLRVGVAYGSDPEKVIGIMEKIAAEHEGVRQKPGPKGYFIEFGDSSLNFRLLAWAHLDNRLEVESEINVLINRRLAEAGIEIPFPQTDLHIRSDATKPPPPGRTKK